MSSQETILKFVKIPPVTLTRLSKCEIAKKKKKRKRSKDCTKRIAKTQYGVETSNNDQDQSKSRRLIKLKGKRGLIKRSESIFVVQRSRFRSRGFVHRLVRLARSSTGSFLPAGAGVNATRGFMRYSIKRVPQDRSINSPHGVPMASNRKYRRLRRRDFYSARAAADIAAGSMSIPL